MSLEKDLAQKLVDEFYEELIYNESLYLSKVLRGKAKECAKIHIRRLIQFSENGCMLCKQSKRESLIQVLTEIDKI